MPKPRTLAALRVGFACLMCAFMVAMSWQAGGLGGMLCGAAAALWALVASDEFKAKDGRVGSVLELLGRNTFSDMQKARQTRKFVGDGPSIHVWHKYTDPSDGTEWRVTVEVLERESED